MLKMLRNCLENCELPLATGAPLRTHNDVYLYEPDLPALKYALKIAKFANLEEELIEDLSTRLSQMEGYEEADLRCNRRTNSDTQIPTEKY
jgi:hypothetical protein